MSMEIAITIIAFIIWIAAVGALTLLATVKTLDAMDEHKRRKEMLRSQFQSWTIRTKDN